jgi:hypothetical protein
LTPPDVTPKHKQEKPAAMTNNDPLITVLIQAVAGIIIAVINTWNRKTPKE